MYSKIIRLIFTGASLAPISVSLAFVVLRQQGVSIQFFMLFGLALLLFIICSIIPKHGSNCLEEFFEHIDGIKSTDSELLSFLLAYCFPLLTSDCSMPDFLTSSYIAVIFGIALYNSNCLYFSPTLGILGYYTYEISLKSGITCILLTKRTLRRVPQEVKVVRLTEYVFLEKV